MSGSDPAAVLRLVLIPPALAACGLPDAALLADLDPAAQPLPGGWPLVASGSPEAAGAALAVLRMAHPALLWAGDGAPGWLARALRAGGFARVHLLALAGADPAPVQAALDLAGLAVTLAQPPLPAALAPAVALAAALPLLIDRARAARQPAEAQALARAAADAATALPAPWPASPADLAAALWPLLAGQPLLPDLPAFDPIAQGPAGLSGKRITFVIEKLAERSGGAERVLIETANALAACGHMVEILSHEHRGRPPFYPTAPGVRLANLRPRREARSRLRRFADMIRAALERTLPDVAPFDRLVWLSRNGGFHRRLARHLAATRPDAVIAFMPPAMVALALADPGVPMRRIVSMHNAPEQDFDNPARWDPSRLDRRRRRAALARMDEIAVLLDEYRAWYPPAVQDRLRVLPNAVAPVAPARLAAARRAPVVLAVGRLAAVKRHALLIEAWGRIIDRFPGWRLQIYGEGPLRAELEAQIAAQELGGSVQLMGHTTDIGAAYLGAALLAHPAEYEGFPLAVTEALAAGLPVLGFDDCSGLNRLVVDGVNGRLVPGAGGGERRTAGFAAALADLMADAGARASLSAAAPATMAPYAPARVIDLWQEMVFGKKDFAALAAAPAPDGPGTAGQGATLEDRADG